MHGHARTYSIPRVQRAAVSEVKRTPMARAQGVARHLGIGAKISKFTHLVQSLVRRLNLTTSSGAAEVAKFHKVTPWMASPDMDSAHWINEIQGVLWPIIQQYVADLMAYKVQAHQEYFSLLVSGVANPQFMISIQDCVVLPRQQSRWW